MPRSRWRAYSASITTPRTASNRPAASAARGCRLLASTTSATPVTTKASAVLNDIGFLLPNRRMAVTRANQAAITVRPTAEQSRPPAVVITSGTHWRRDGTPAGPSGAAGSEAAGPSAAAGSGAAGPSGAAGSGAAGAPAGADRASSVPWISMGSFPASVSDTSSDTAGETGLVSLNDNTNSHCYVT